MKKSDFQASIQSLFESIGGEFCIKTVNACSKFVFKCQIQYQTKFHYLQLKE